MAIVIPSPNTTFSTRDVRIDVIRGLAVLIISSDHIPGNVLSDWTLRAWGFCDLAEVFVFLAGFVCGQSYGRSLRYDGFMACQKKAAVRSSQIYLATIVTTCVIVLMSSPPVGGRSRSSTHSTVDGLLQMVVSAAALQNLDGNLAILPLYCSLLLALPIWLVLRRRHPIASVLSSCLLYGIAQILPWNGDEAGGYRVQYNPLGWQLLFFGGAALSESHKYWSTVFSRWWIVALASLFLQWSFLMRATYPDMFPALTFKPALGILRVVHFIAVTIVFTFVTPSSETFGGLLLAPLRMCGRHSLVTFCAGDVAVSIASSFPPAESGLWPQLAINLAVWATCLAAALVASGIGLLIRSRRNKPQVSILGTSDRR